MSKHRINKWAKRKLWPLERQLRLKRTPAEAIAKAEQHYGVKLEREAKS